MGLLDFFKGKKEKEKTPKEKYWSLATYDGEIVEPTLEQMEAAVKDAHPNGRLFATLAYNHSGLEIESVQATSQDGRYYRFEALTTTGIMYVKNDILYEETLEYFKHFFKDQKVAGFRSWDVENY